VLIEVSELAWADIAPAETALASYHIAGSFRGDTIIDDPSGRLRQLQRQVAPAFAREAWVRRRCQGVLHKSRDALQTIDRAAPWHDQVTGWLFATGVTAHLPLVAALRNPTVRLRYPRARAALADHGLADRYPAFLDLLGGQGLTSGQVGLHLEQLARTFDAASAVAKTRFFFSSDITPAARAIAIDAGRALVAEGDHREAMFWIVATFARCQKILAADAPPALQPEHAAAFARVLGDLGIGSSDDIAARAGETLAALPGLWRTAEDLMAVNPEIVRPEVA